ncbi:unnamed protein product [Caenorhabditis auriculariae]|uniref:F-box domain-containing protein n=1 Tax=Caenorhabditis auriculariae TaxID=2777116 RepID=A0A8S1HC35_9PELO|nr:unnamed protein product [Caenorhabditis auriculariae]
MSLQSTSKDLPHPIDRTVDQNRPLWSAMVASLVLGNARGLLYDATTATLRDLCDAYRRAHLAGLRVVDSLLATRSHDAEIVRLRASGCLAIREPDAFMEQFTQVPTEVLDLVFQRLRSADICRVQQVSHHWRNLALARRSKYAKRELGSLTIDYNKKITRISDCTGSIGIFGGALKFVFQCYENLRIASLDINVHGLNDDVTPLHLDDVDARAVKIYFYINLHSEKERVELLVSAVTSNPRVQRISFVSFGNGSEFPKWFQELIQDKSDIELSCY